MGNKAENLIRRIELHCGSAYSERLFSEIKKPREKALPKRQGEFILAAVERLRRDFPNTFVRELIRPCGYCCISVSTIKTARKIYRESLGDMATVLERLNAEGIGGGKLRFENGLIIARYDQCRCSVPLAFEKLPPEYCECSAGWFEKLFSETFGREAAVTIRRSIITGGDCCEFEIELAE